MEAATTPEGEYDTLLQQYFGKDWRVFKRIMLCESGGNPAAHNWNPATGDDSWGILQINRYGKLAATRPLPAKLIDPEFNIRYAAGMFHAQGYKPWSCAKKLGIS